MKVLVLALLLGVPGGYALAQAGPLPAAPFPDELKGPMQVALAAFTAGGTLAASRHMAAAAKREAADAKAEAEEAERKANAANRRIDDVVRELATYRETRARWEGVQEGAVSAWKDRLDIVGKGVHDARDVLGERITRIEDRLDAMS